MFKKIFISGLAAIIPLVITIYVIIGLFHFADSILGDYINSFLRDYLGYEIPGLGIVIAILIVFLLGVLVHISRLRFFRWFTHWIEGLFFKIPLVNKIYFPVRRIVDFLFFSTRKNFKSAVLVEYPRKGIYSIGFVTAFDSLKFEKRGQKRFYNIFVPSSPSPLTGFTIIVPQEEVIVLDIAVDEAINLLVSGGLLNP